MVLIDREKPSSCGHCWYDKICKRWRTQDWGCPPPTDCPLKELSPHGDLIDRDALINFFANNGVSVILGWSASRAVDEIVKFIKKAPAVIPESEDRT